MQLARQLMIEKMLKANGIRESQVLNAFATVPRHEFVLAKYRHQAYWNQRLSIGYQQTMLSPLIMAKMLEALRLSGAEDILEVGTGSGYLTALLTHLGAYVFSLEQIPQLAEKASYRLQKLKQDNVDLHIGDGSQGLADMASFDVIVITAYVKQIPRPLALQLHPLRGRMIIPVGDAKQQDLKLIRREANHWYSHTISSVQLPRLKGRYGVMPPSASV
ncbi:MAG: protein-L-isoaspartate(D-aspartate) O-methyltransferase [Phototrophicaceae bacterium]